MKIAITGGVGSGKSTVIKALHDKLKDVYCLVSVDAIVHETWKSIELAVSDGGAVNFNTDGSNGSSILRVDAEAIKTALGQEIYTQKAVSDFAWSCPENRKKVEKFINPVISQALQSRLNQPFVMVEFPTLFENGKPHDFDLIINVASQQDRRIVRAMKRSNWSYEKANSVVHAQLNDGHKRTFIKSNKLQARFIQVTNHYEDEEFKVNDFEDTKPLIHTRDFSNMIAVLANLVKQRSVPFLRADSKKIGIIAGSFDPVTIGHLWMFKEALSVMDHIIVLSAHNTKKNYFFTEEERNHLICASIAEFDPEFSSRVHVITLPSEELVVRYAAEVEAKAIFRGIRNFGDFQDESTQLLVQRTIAPDINIFYMIPPRELTEVSSSLVKGMLTLREGSTLVKPYVSASVWKALNAKLAWQAIEEVSAKKSDAY